MDTTKDGATKEATATVKVATAVMVPVTIATVAGGATNITAATEDTVAILIIPDTEIMVNTSPTIITTKIHIKIITNNNNNIIKNDYETNKNLKLNRKKKKLKTFKKKI